MKLNELTIKETSEGLKKGEFTSVYLAKACLDRIKKIDGKIRAFLLVDEKGAIAKYKQAASKATDSGLKKMFTEMMEEEKIHVQLIEDKIVQLQKKKA